MIQLPFHLVRSQRGYAGIEWGISGSNRGHAG